jgi:putative addiction module component (TIGR02574 family)
MSRTFEEVRDEALAMSPEDRGHLADELMDSLPVEHGIEWDDEYAAEIQRRVAEIDTGTAEVIDSDEAIAEARRLLSDARQTSSSR